MVAKAQSHEASIRVSAAPAVLSEVGSQSSTLSEPAATSRCLWSIMAATPASVVAGHSHGRLALGAIGEVPSVVKWVGDCLPRPVILRSVFTPATANVLNPAVAKQVSKPNIFWAPSLETARKIDDEDTVKSIETARYRFAASMADLERCYDEQASRLRAAFVAEVAQLYQNEAA
jgi:hypothetical protein